jgi:hypothetical protein
MNTGAKLLPADEFTDTLHVSQIYQHQTCAPFCGR